MKKNSHQLRVAIVHDYLRTYGGGERVLEALHQLWPTAPVFVASISHTRMAPFMDKFSDYDLRTSWVQRIPLFSERPIFYRPLLPLVWKSFDLSQFDVVISSSGSNMSKLVSVPPEALHICYCHTPPRFLYNYETELNLQHFPLSHIIGPLNTYLRHIDLESSKKVDCFVANSAEVASRIQRIYHRSATVIYPPVIMPSLSRVHQPRSYYLVVSRLVRHKHIDLVIEVANKYHLPLRIVGSGTELERLRSIAGPTVSFFGEVSDEVLSEMYQQAIALIVASKDEDFGITPVEAMSYGTPVVAYRSGGLQETVIHGLTGMFFNKLTVKSLADAIHQLERAHLVATDCVQQAQQFSLEKFKINMRRVVEENLIRSSK